VIAFLNVNVDDPRFAFHHLDAHNDLYNPAGQPLESFTELPVGDERFDIICLFSSSPTWAPHDYRAMLSLLRRHISPSGGLVFRCSSTRASTPTPGPPSSASSSDDWRRRSVSPSGHPGSAASGAPTDGVSRLRRPHPPTKPLMKAVYSEPYAAGSSRNRMDSPALHPPEEPFVQHYFVCRPI